ncbi:MAG: hypothetical protein U1E62_01400 [Alsobacter sp.]
MAVALLPLVFIEVPPLVDYPNHLARAAFLARGAASQLSDVYAVVWQNLPNLGTDVLMMGMIEVMPPTLAGRIFIGLVLVLLMAGMGLYARVVFGRWSWWSAVGLLAAYNGTFLFGFLSFNLACGEALFFAAGWRAFRWSRPWLASGLLSLAVVLIWFTHVGGLLFLSILCFSHEVSILLDRKFKDFSVRQIALSCLHYVPAAVLVALLAVTSPFMHVTGPSWMSLSTKPYQFYLALTSYEPLWDVPPLVLTAAFLLLCGASGRLTVDRPTLIAVFLCLGLFVVSPMVAKGGTWVATRFAVMAWLLCFSGLLPEPRDRRLIALAALLVLSCGVRLAGITSIWAEENARVAQARRALSCLAPGAVVGVYSWPMDGNGPRRPHITGGMLSLDSHVGAWAITDRDAKWVNLFAIEGQQPIRLQASYRAFEQPTHVLEPLGRIVEGIPDGSLQLSPEGQRFDAILLVHADGATLPPISGLTLVAVSGQARLFGVGGRGIEHDCRPGKLQPGHAPS